MRTDISFDDMFEFCMRWEGGLTEDADDHGGITKYGVSIAFLRSLERTDRAFLLGCGLQLPVTSGTIRAVTKAQARQLFRHVFYDEPGFDSLPRAVGWCLFDCAVNTGVSRSVKCAQRGWNATHPQGIPLSVDGIFGPKTKVALRTASPELVDAIITERELFYLHIGIGSQAKFLRGWLNRTTDLRKTLEV